MTTTLMSPMDTGVGGLIQGEFGNYMPDADGNYLIDSRDMSTFLHMGMMHADIAALVATSAEVKKIREAREERRKKEAEDLRRSLEAQVRAEDRVAGEAAHATHDSPRDAQAQHGSKRT